MDTKKELESPEMDKVIVKHYAGSISYGTNLPSSDTDYRGIFLAPKKYIVTPFFNVYEKTDSSEEDTKYFELNNFIKLYTDANPNIVETMWVDKKHIVDQTDEYKLLRKYNQDLLSSKIAFSYTGYAHNQATRMINHHSWFDKERHGIEELNRVLKAYSYTSVMDWIIDSFPDYIVSQLTVPALTSGSTNVEKFMRNYSLQMLSTKPLKHYHFIKLIHNYMDTKVVDNTFNILDYNEDHELYHYGDNFYALLEKSGTTAITNDGAIRTIDYSNRNNADAKVLPKLLVKFNKDEYEKSYDNRKSYHSWKKNRNSKRAELEQKHGYDTKFAMHTVRLLRTAKEALEDGVINVLRPDAKELLEIRDGKWTYDELINYYNYMDNEIKTVSYKNTVLPKRPNIELASKVLMEIRDMQWDKK